MVHCEKAKRKKISVEISLENKWWVRQVLPYLSTPVETQEFVLLWEAIGRIQRFRDSRSNKLAIDISWSIYNLQCVSNTIHGGPLINLISAQFGGPRAEPECHFSLGIIA